MKKLLSIFGTMALTTTASTSATACGNPQEKQDLENSNQKLKDEKDKLEKLNKELNQKLKDEKDKLEKLNKELKTIKWTINREIEYIPDSAFSKNITIEVDTNNLAEITESQLTVALIPIIKKELNKFHSDITSDHFSLSYPYFVGNISTIDLTKDKLVSVHIRGRDDTKIKGAKTVNIVLKAITKTS